MKSNEDKFDNHNYAELNRSDDKGADFWKLLISEYLKSENNEKTNFKNEKNFDDFNFVELNSLTDAVADSWELFISESLKSEDYKQILNKIMLNEPSL